MLDVLKSNKFAFGLTVLFSCIVFLVNDHHYLTFNLHGPDSVFFSQAMWNTVNGGGFLISSLSGRHVLSFHFTPIFALLSPLLLIWEDMRILFLAQIVALASTGLILYRLVATKYVKLAPWFLLAFYLNPTLHEIAVNELRRIPFAMPFIALALYGLFTKRRTLTLISVLFALLAKENIAIFVLMVGVYLILFERDWRWGLGYVVSGIAWALLFVNVFSPWLAGFTDGYPQIGDFGVWGNSPQEIVVNVLRNPVLALQTILEPDRIQGLGRLFLPLGIILPFFAPRWVLISLPSLGLILLSSRETMHSLQDWYLAPVLPILFFAIAISLISWSEKTAQRATGFLLVTTMIGFYFFSYIPPGRKAILADYTYTDHHRRATKVIELIPDNASVATQAAFLPHLLYRHELYSFFSDSYDEEIPRDYYLLDPILNPYPLNELSLKHERGNLVADPNRVVVAEVDEIFLIRTGGEQNPSFAVNAVAEEKIKLERVDVATMDEIGWYRPKSTSPIPVTPNQQVRIALYWEALDAMDVERTVSVRIIDSAGQLVGQMDSQPSGGARPTSWWEPGWYFRDTYYLTIAPHAQLGAATIDVLLYDSFSAERVPFGDKDILSVANLLIE